MIDYLSAKVRCRRYGLVVYPEQLAWIPGDQVEPIVSEVARHKLWFQKGDDTKFFTCQGAWWTRGAGY
jgi:hypothetical protein